MIPDEFFRKRAGNCWTKDVHNVIVPICYSEDDNGQMIVDFDYIVDMFEKECMKIKKMLEDD